MEKKRLFPITGLAIGLCLGGLIEWYIWQKLAGITPSGIIKLPVAARGGVDFGPGMFTIVSGCLGGLTGGLIIDFMERGK